MTPFVDDPDFSLYVGDVREVLRAFPAGSVNCCVTSPPYWGLRDYGTGEWEGGDSEHAHVANGGRNIDLNTPPGGGSQKHVPGAPNRGGVNTNLCDCGAIRIDQQIGLEPTPDEYVAAIVDVFREVRRVLADDGTLWLNLGDSYNTYAGNRGITGSTLEGRRQHLVNRPDVPQGAGLATADLKQKDLVGIPWRVARAMQDPYYAGRLKDERERIWLAAVVEAEGCMFIHKRKVGQSNGQGYERKTDSYGAGLEVSSTDRVIVERCMAITGIGSICEQSPEANPRRKQTVYRWNVRSNECRWIIQELYPHFYAKQHEARLLLGCPSSGDDARKAHESLKALHQGQEACIDFGEPEGMWERGWFLRSEIIWAKLCRTPCLNP